MSERQTGRQSKLDRRGFLRLAGLGAGGVALAAYGVDSTGGSAGSTVLNAGAPLESGKLPIELGGQNKNQMEILGDHFRDGSIVSKGAKGGFSPDTLKQVDVNIYVENSNPDKKQMRVKGARVTIVRPDENGKYTTRTVDLKKNPSLALKGLDLTDPGQRVSVGAPYFWTCDGYQYPKIELKKPSEGPSEVHVIVYVTRPGGEPRRVPERDQNA